MPMPSSSQVTQALSGGRRKFRVSQSGMSSVVVEWCEFTGRRVVSAYWLYNGVRSLVVEWCELTGCRVV